MAGRRGKTQVGVLTVIEEEFDRTQLALKAEQRVPNTNYWHGATGAERFVLTRMADRGNVAAGQATTKLIELWQPDVVLLVGIAGGVYKGKGPGLGDLVVPDYIHYADFRKITEGGDHLRYAAYDQPTVSLRESHVEGLIQEDRWIDRLSEPRPSSAGLRRDGILRRRSAESSTRPRAHVGALVATEKILGDPDHPEQTRLFVTFDDALAVDMESFGVARAVHGARFDPTYNPRLSIVRGISDLVRPRSPRARIRAGKRGIGRSGATIEINNDERRLWKGYAAASAASFAAELVDEIC